MADLFGYKLSGQGHLYPDATRADHRVSSDVLKEWADFQKKARALAASADVPEKPEMIYDPSLHGGMKLCDD